MTGDCTRRTVDDMAGDIDPYQAQWNLRPKIDALRAEAASLRAQNVERYRTSESEFGIQRDRLAREHYGLEQQAKSADIQVRVENTEVERISTGLAKREAAMAAAEKRGDTAKVQEDREDIAAWRAELATHQARARQATLDAAELKERAATVDRQRTELQVARDDSSSAAGRVEAELDKMERQADLMQQARLKYAEADMATDDIPRRAALELEAEALVRQAGAVPVDRDAIRVVFPELPATTPGYDADPGPLPAGAAADDASSAGEPAPGLAGDEHDPAAAADTGIDDDVVGTDEDVLSVDDDVLGVDAAASTDGTSTAGDEAPTFADDTAAFEEPPAIDLEGASMTELSREGAAELDGALEGGFEGGFEAVEAVEPDRDVFAASDLAASDLGDPDAGFGADTDFASQPGETDLGFANPEPFEPEPSPG